MRTTQYLLSFLCLFFSFNLFAVDAYSLPNNQWRMISLPAEPPADENTVAKVFGDDISGTYGTDWVLYQFNTQTNSYGDSLKLSDAVEQGRGYWIIQKTGGSVTLTMPPGSTAAPDSYSFTIGSATGNNTQWTLSGNPFSSSQALGDFSLRTDSGVCSDNPCDLDKAESEKLLHNQVWVYDGAYKIKNKQDTLNSWDGFWVASLKNSQGHVLSLQKTNNSPVSSLYVAPNGSDSNVGSINSPFASITKASSAASAGDVVVIKAGEYRERVDIKKSGDKGKPISFVGEPGAVLNGEGVSFGNDGGLLNINEKQHIVISGFRIINSGWAGISIDKSNDIYAKNNETYNTKSSGFHVVESSGITIGGHSEKDGNKVELACNGGTEEAITISISSDVDVGYNDVSNSGLGDSNNIGGEGIDIKNGSNVIRVFHNKVHDNDKLGIYIDAWNKKTFDIEVSNNEVFNIVDNGITLASEKSGELNDIRIIGNKVSKNDNGIVVGGRGWLDNQIAPPHKGITPMIELVIRENTVYENRKEGIYIDNVDAKNVLVEDNISKNNAGYQIARGATPRSELTVRNNQMEGAKLTWQLD